MDTRRHERSRRVSDRRSCSWRQPRPDWPRDIFASPLFDKHNGWRLSHAEPYKFHVVGVRLERCRL